jgi:hypothetical protein
MGRSHNWIGSLKEVIMIIVLTEMFESCSDTDTMIIDTNKLPPKLRAVIENAEYNGFGVYLASADSCDTNDESFEDAVVALPALVVRIVLFWWEG